MWPSAPSGPEGLVLGPVLAEGRHAVVYRATDAAGASWALKRLKPGREPAMKEWRLSGSLPQAPGLLRPVSRGEDAAGPWLLLPFCEGGPLSARLRTGPLAPEAVRILLRRMVGVLDVLHPRWVHRDLAPGNILFDAGGEAWLADFGCLLESGRVPAVPRDGLGTPAYAAPELLMGGPARPESDLYALGAICYECLTGAAPFPPDRPERTAVRKLGGGPRPLAEAVPGVPTDLARIVEGMMALRPGDRLRPSPGGP